MLQVLTSDCIAVRSSWAQCKAKSVTRGGGEGTETLPAGHIQVQMTGSGNKEMESLYTAMLCAEAAASNCSQRSTHLRNAAL